MNSKEINEIALLELMEEISRIELEAQKLNIRVQRLYQQKQTLEQVINLQDSMEAMFLQYQTIKGE